MTSFPLVSIVVPIYNQKLEFLKECIDSIINQTYQNIEIILSDNHSDTGVYDILKEYARLDNRVKVYRPDAFLPLTTHWAFAAQQVKGKYMSFLSSDDWVCPNWLCKMISVMEANENVAWAYAEVEKTKQYLNNINGTFRGNKMPSGIYKASDSFKKYITLVECGWMVGNVIRTTAYKKTGGIQHTPIVYSSDFSLAFKLHEVGDVFYLNEPVGQYREWGHEQGKPDSIRIRQSIIDFKAIYEIAEKSNILQSYLEKPVQIINKWKKFYAISLAKGIIVACYHGYVPKNDKQVMEKELLKFNDSILVRSLLFINNTPLRHLYGIFSWIKSF